MQALASANAGNALLSLGEILHGNPAQVVGVLACPRRPLILDVTLGAPQPQSPTRHRGRSSRRRARRGLQPVVDVWTVRPRRPSECLAPDQV